MVFFTVYSLSINSKPTAVMNKLTFIAFTLLSSLLPVGFVYADAPKDIVYNMFNEVLKRNPTREEFAIYMDLVIENGWDNSDLKSVLRQKKSDAINHEIYGEPSREYDAGYEQHRDRGSDGARRQYSGREYYEKRRWVEAAFEEELERLPSRREMDDYCDLCLDERYSKSDLRRRVGDDFRGKSRMSGRDRNGRYDYDRYSSDEEVEIIIEDLFQKELGEAVDRASMRKYRRLMIDEGWSERQIRNDIVSSPKMVREDLEKVVVRAYEDLLGQRPGPRDRDYYVDEMIKRRLDEKGLRQTIKRSREYTVDRPRTLIDTAYKRVLLRDADPSAYALERMIVQKDWDLEAVENHLRQSQEYRTQTVPKMLELAYEELLNRRPDPYGIGFYTERAMEGWSFEQIKDHIRASDEYAKTH